MTEVGTSNTVQGVPAGATTQLHVVPIVRTTATLPCSMADNAFVMTATVTPLPPTHGLTILGARKGTGLLATRRQHPTSSRWTNGAGSRRIAQQQLSVIKILYRCHSFINRWQRAVAEQAATRVANGGIPADKHWNRWRPRSAQMLKLVEWQLTRARPHWHAASDG